MARVAGDRPPDWVLPSTVSRTFKVSVVTPMFGGGATLKEANANYPLRAAAIRGSLRFWWRAVKGCHHATAAKLFAAEEQLWGSMSVPGKIAISVTVDDKGKSQPCAVYPPGKSFPQFTQGWPPYALFSFKGQSSRGAVEESPSSALVGVKFTLTITADAASMEDADAAVYAWLLYGGVGSRTRRGCGSLKLEGAVPVVAAMQERADGGLIPALYGANLAQRAPVKDAATAWNDAVSLYQQFRQGVDFARNRGSESNRPGRSRWPEPDAIRRLTNQYANQHKPAHRVEMGFPRADLGLPIVFHFQGERVGDPHDTTLQGESGRSRMASPVITKAVQCADGFIPTVLVLNAPHVWEGTDVELKGNRVNRANIELSEAERKNVPPLNGHHVREALLVHAAKQPGWQRSNLS